MQHEAGLSNHVIYDRIWESQKLAKCSLKAALAYPWIYLVADDWGRFEYHPRVVWGRVFGAREDVKLRDVTGWLEEYRAIGLLAVYEKNGREVAAWTRFSGPPPSKRHAATLPGPNGRIESKGFKYKSRFQSAARSQQSDSIEARSRKQEAGNRKLEAGNGKQESGGDAATNPAPSGAARPAAVVRSVRRQKPGDDTQESRTGVDDHARITGRKADYSGPKLALFARLLREGRTGQEWCRVLEALQARSVPSAAFARDGNGTRPGPGPGLSWALRPGPDGGFDRILLQLDEREADPTAGSLAPKPRLPGPPSKAELLDRKVARLLGGGS
jgi:hypothetical protein